MLELIIHHATHPCLYIYNLGLFEKFDSPPGSPTGFYLIMLPVHDYLVILSDTEKFTWNKPTQVSLSGK